MTTPAKVVVVEDERIVALNLQQRLLKLGYEVPLIASSCEEAISGLEFIHPDVVLMDIHIEGDVDGIETARRLRSEVDVPVVYLTAYSEEATLKRARETKPYGYLLKPFSERELHATIQVALERHQVEQALRESEQRLHLALEAAQMGFWELDGNDERLLRAGRIDRIFGCAAECFSGTLDTFLQRVHEDDRTAVAGVLTGALSQGGLCHAEFRGVHEDGSVRWLKIQGKAFPSASCSPRIVGVVQDVTAEREAEDRLRQAATVFQATQDGILIVDAEHRVISCNKAYCDITGDCEDDLVGKIPRLLAPEMFSADVYEDFCDSLVCQGRWEAEINARRSSGEDFPVRITIAAVENEQGRLTHYVAMFSDMSVVRQVENQLQRLAHHNPLTGLPNRLLAMDRLEHAIDRARRIGARVGVIFVDLDQFKRINDALGHWAGDALLRGVGERMSQRIGTGNTVARLGGDEFMIIIEDVAQVDDLAVLATQIAGSISEPFQVSGRELRTAASLGIALYPDDGSGIQELLRAADTAMYAAKYSGRQRYAFHTPEMTAAAQRFVKLHGELQRALLRGDFNLHYQPQISMRTGEISGVEALIRWKYGKAQECSASDVIAIAEESDLIIGVGEWVITHACEQAKQWQIEGLPPLRMSVNVSAGQMRHDSFFDTVRQAIRDARLAPGQLEIEITESMLQNDADCLSTLWELKRLGVGLAIDDFGVGYSCFSSLKSLPLHRLKIDKEFVRDIPQDHNDAAIAEAIIAMAHRLGLEVTAEGVETVEQDRFLRSCGCAEGQGYLYARPLPAQKMEAFLKAWAGNSH